MEFFSQLNVSLFYCGVIFRNVFMLHSSHLVKSYITVIEHAMTQDVLRQTQVVFKILSDLATIYTFLSIKHC